LTRTHKRTIEFEGIQTKSSLLGAPNKDDGQKTQLMVSTILLVNIILAAVVISFVPHFSVWQFSAVCKFYTRLAQTIYYVFRSMSVWS